MQRFQLTTVPVLNKYLNIKLTSSNNLTHKHWNTNYNNARWLDAQVDVSDTLFNYTTTKLLFPSHKFYAIE